MRHLPRAAAALLAVLAPAVSLAVAPKKTPSKTTARKKAATKSATAPSPAANLTSAKSVNPRAKAARRRTSVRRVPKAPPVSPKVRAVANEEVTEALDRPVEVSVENAAALVPFFEQLYRHQHGEPAQPLHVLHWGDSHTSSDDFTGSIRYLLQNQFGDGGAGFSLPGSPYPGYRRLDLRGGSTRGWKSEGLLKNDGDGLYGMSGVSVATTRPGESIWLQAECGRLEILYLRQPGGGPLALLDQGVEVGRLTTDGETGPGSAAFDIQPGSHSFELRTLERAPVRLYGWVTEKERGITYESMGINGAQASVMFHWDERMMAEYVGKRSPALIVLAYGTNESTNPDWTRDSYREMFAALLHRLRNAAPTASILVLGPPDRWLHSRRGWAPSARIETIKDAQREAALAAGCSFWDMQDKMGGPGAMRQWVLAGLAQYDHVHFTVPGYRRLGHVLFRDLMYNYDKYVKVRGELSGIDSGNGGLRPEGPRSAGTN